MGNTAGIQSCTNKDGCDDKKQREERHQPGPIRCGIREAPSNWGVRAGHCDDLVVKVQMETCVGLERRREAEEALQRSLVEEIITSEIPFIVLSRTRGTVNHGFSLGGSQRILLHSWFQLQGKGTYQR